MGKIKYLKIIVMMCVAISCVAAGYWGVIAHNDRRLGHNEEKKEYYSVQEIQLVETENNSPLYCASGDVEDVFYETARKYGVVSTPITVFRHQENYDEGNGDFVWFPQFEEGKLTDFLIVHKWVTEKMTVCYASDYWSNYVTLFRTLANMTSEELPLYIVTDGEYYYAVIGDQAYAQEGYAFTSKLSQLYKEETVKVIEIKE